MNCFNLKRLWNVMRADLIGNRSTYAYYLGGLFVVLILGELLCFWQSDLEGFDHLFMTTYSLLFFYGLGFYAISRTFVPLSTKQKRINYLMLPATNLEKFVSRLLICTVGYVVFFYVAFIAADLLRLLILSALGRESEWAISLSLNQPSIHIPESSWTINRTKLTFLAKCMFLLSYVAYLLGSAVFRKHPFIKTSLCHILFNIVLVTALNVALNNGFIVNLYDNMELESAITVLCATAVLLNILCIWLSYRLFCRLPVIPQTHQFHFPFTR